MSKLSSETLFLKLWVWSLSNVEICFTFAANVACPAVNFLISSFISCRCSLGHQVAPVTSTQGKFW